MTTLARCCVCSFIIITHWCSTISAQLVDIPDPNLESAIRETLNLSDNRSITQQEILRLTNLEAAEKGITDLTGLEHATFLQVLDLPGNLVENLTPLMNLMQLIRLSLDNNQIRDISPLANLTNLERLRLSGNQIGDISPLVNLTNLKSIGLRVNQIHDLRPLAGLIHLEGLGLNGNQISDISPLMNLTNLETLHLSGNLLISDIAPLADLTQLMRLSISRLSISNITPLANLTQLTYLLLNDNQIFDFSPLANLVNLEKLWINRNPGIDIDSLGGLNLVEFHYDAPCHIEPTALSVRERIENRIFPSVFAAWGSVGRSPVRNLPELSGTEHIALHDLYLCCPLFGLRFVETDEGWKVVGDLAEAQKRHDDLTSLNPNMLFLVEIRMHDAFADTLPEDWPYWLRDAAGNRTSSDDNDFSQLLIDFTEPGMQDIIVQQAIAVAKCGLYDGIFFDWWTENHAVLANNTVGWSEGYRGLETELRARDNILQRIRAEVSDDFLIMVNTNRDKIPRTGPYINGTFMETFKDHSGGYSHNELQQLESTLSWAELNLREPRINGLEAQGLSIEPPDGPNNLRMMRAITTLSLTHSDGYVLYTDGVRDLGGPHHHHLWHDFWDANLGRPIGPKAQQYENVEGLFIREFTNGWAVYNRSGTAQEISLAENATGVASGQTGRTHQLADLDGEIYLRAGTRPTPTDINGDGVVNILDLILVAQNFGTTKSDINGDGTTNILDLILVAQHLGETSTAAAPSALPASISPETVREWIDMAHAQNDGSVVFAQGIAMLEKLLALMIPDKTVLRANYPNPFNPETWIPYHLADDTEVRINIYDIQGVLVRQFNLGYQKAGYYTDRRKAAYWDGRNEIGESVASGVYFYTLTTDNYTGTRRMTIIK